MDYKMMYTSKAWIIRYCVVCILSFTIRKEFLIVVSYQIVVLLNNYNLEIP